MRLHKSASSSLLIGLLKTPRAFVNSELCSGLLCSVVAHIGSNDRQHRFCYKLNYNISVFRINQKAILLQT